MKKNLYLGILIATIVITFLVLPNIVFVQHTQLSIVIPFFISVFSFGGFISEHTEIRNALITFDENGKKNDQNFMLAIVASLFVFIGIFAFNQSRIEAIEFNVNSITTEGTIVFSEKKISENDARITVEFLDSKQIKHKGLAEFEVPNSEFYKYALGRKVTIKYLSQNPEIVKILALDGDVSKN